jgi:hypothetical protein
MPFDDTQAWDAISLNEFFPNSGDMSGGCGSDSRYVYCSSYWPNLDAAAQGVKVVKYDVTQGFVNKSSYEAFDLLESGLIKNPFALSPPVVVDQFGPTTVLLGPLPSNDIHTS